MNIAILGGRFDPPHIGHFLIAKQVLELRPDIEKLLLVPTAKHQWKPIIARGKDRLAMLTCFTNDKITVSDIELRRKGISYTKDTLAEIKQKTGAQLYWIVGSDILSELYKWEKADDLTGLATFLVFPRDPFSLPKTLPKGFEAIRSKNLLTTNFSSTLIRQRIKEGKTIRYMVPKEIASYIKIHNLY